MTNITFIDGRYLARPQLTKEIKYGSKRRKIRQ